jgi:hypothetical protein
MARFFPAALLALLFAVGGWSGGRAQDGTPTTGFDPTARFPVHLHAGTCDDPDKVVSPLAEAGYGLPVPLVATPDPAAATAVVVGTAGFNAAAASVTEVPLSLDDLVAAEHALDAHSAADGPEAETRIVCGEVGGFRAGNDLVFGLGERNGSNYGGAAWLRDNGDGTTTVVVFLVSGLASEANAAGAAGAAAGDAMTEPTAAGTDAVGEETIEGDGAIAVDRVAIPDASPTALDDLPDDIEEATVSIAGGAFGVDEIVLREDEPTVLRVDNRDDLGYFLGIGDLVPAAAIPARRVTEIQFTTPNAGVYEGRLVASDEATVLDTVRVIVQSAGATAP